MIDRKLVDLMALSLDASLRPEAWETLLDEMVAYAQAISGVIIVSDPAHARRETPFQSRFIRQDARDMLERFLAREDVDDAPAYRHLQTLPVNRLYSEPEIFGCDGPEFLPPSQFRDFQRDSFGINYRQVMPVNNFVNCADNVTLHSAMDLTRGDHDIREGIETLAPFLGKALRLYRIFSALRARFDAVLSALDRLKLGTVLMLEDATIVHSNETARAIFATNDGLKMDRAKRIEASDTRQAATLRAAISEVSRTAMLNGWTAERSFTILRPSGRPDYLMTLGPIVDSQGELEKGLACAIAFIADPAEATPIATDGLAEIGRLTPSEAVVCHHLVNGLSLQEIAERRGVSRETIKTQASGIMSKLSCKSRLDLVRLAALTRLPLDDPAGRQQTT